MLHLCAFSEGQRILDVDPQVPSGAFDSRVPSRICTARRLPAC